MGLLFQCAVVLSEAYLKRLTCNRDSSNMVKGIVQRIFFYPCYRMMLRLITRFGVHLPVAKRLRGHRNVFRLFGHRMNLTHVESSASLSQVYTNLAQMVSMLVLWWSHQIVMEYDCKDMSLEYMVGIPVELYRQRLKTDGMKDLPKGCLTREKDRLSMEMLATQMHHFEPLVTVVVTTKKDGSVDAGVCDMGKFWQAPMHGEVIVNPLKQYDYVYPELDDDRMVVVIPLERFLEVFLFSLEDPYPSFTDHLEVVLDRSMGGWIAIRELFGTAENKPYNYPNGSTAVAKFMEVDAKKKKDKSVPMQLAGIKELIGFDVAHARVGGEDAGDGSLSGLCCPMEEEKEDGNMSHGDVSACDNEDGSGDDEDRKMAALPVTGQGRASPEESSGPNCVNEMSSGVEDHGSAVQEGVGVVNESVGMVMEGPDDVVDGRGLSQESAHSELGGELGGMASDEAGIATGGSGVSELEQHGSGSVDGSGVSESEQHGSVSVDAAVDGIHGNASSTRIRIPNVSRAERQVSPSACIGHLPAGSEGAAHRSVATSGSGRSVGSGVTGGGGSGVESGSGTGSDTAMGTAMGTGVSRASNASHLAGGTQVQESPAVVTLRGDHDSPSVSTRRRRSSRSHRVVRGRVRGSGFLEVPMSRRSDVLNVARHRNVDADGSVASGRNLVGGRGNVSGSSGRPVRACRTDHLAAAASSLVRDDVAGSTLNESVVAGVVQHGSNLRGASVVLNAGSETECEAAGRSSLSLLAAAGGVGPVENMMDVGATGTNRAGESSESVEPPLGVLPPVDGGVIGGARLELESGHSSTSVSGGMDEVDGSAAVDGGVDASSAVVPARMEVEERLPIVDAARGNVNAVTVTGLNELGSRNDISGAATLESRDVSGLEVGASKEMRAQWETEFLEYIRQENERIGLNYWEGYKTGHLLVDELLLDPLNEYWDSLHPVNLEEEDGSFLEFLIDTVVTNVLSQSFILSLRTVSAHPELKRLSDDWLRYNNRVRLLALESAPGRAWIWDSVCRAFHDWKWKGLYVHSWLSGLDRFFFSMDKADIPDSGVFVDGLEESMSNLDPGHSLCDGTNEEEDERGRDGGVDGSGGDDTESECASDEEDVMMNDLIRQVGGANSSSTQMGAMIEGVRGVCLDGGIGKRPSSDVNEIDDSLKKMSRT